MSRVPSGSMAAFGAAALVDAVGTGCFLAASALFFTRAVGLDGKEVGVGLMLSGCVGLAATVPWGRAADRFGPRPVLVVLLLMRAAAFFAYSFVTSFAGFLAVAVFLGLADKATGPVQQSLVGATAGAERRQRTLAAMRSTRNVGFTVGAGLAGLVLTRHGTAGLRGVVIVNALSFVAAAALMGAVPDRRSGPPAEPAPAASGRVARRYLALTAVNGVLTLHMSLLSVGIPLWLVTRTSLPGELVPALIALNTILAVLLQVPVAAAVKDDDRRAATALTAAGVALGGCAALMPVAAALGGAPGAAVAAAAVVLLTAAELLQAAGGWHLSFRFAPEEAQGRHLSVFSLGVSLQTIAGPLVLTTAVFAAGTAGWIALAVVLVAAGGGARSSWAWS